MKAEPALRVVCAVAFVSLIAVAGRADAATRYVRQGAVGANNGMNWTDAYTSLQQALVDAIAGDQIWVAVGTYKPSSPGGRASTFQLRNNITIYGGFRGLAGDEGINNATTRPPDPAPGTANPATDSILSGDLNGNDGPNFADYADNTYHLTTGTSTNATAVLDGFTIRGGNSSGAPDQRGGGLFNDGGSPTIRNCAFLANLAGNDGGGAHEINGTATSYSNCLFQGNSALGGGAVVINKSSSPSFQNCQFIANSSTFNLGGGGAIRCRTDNPLPSKPVFSGCTFMGNTAANYGGAMFLDIDAQPLCQGCTFSGNTGVLGGAVCADNCPGLFVNCRFLGNSASNSGGANYNRAGAHPSFVNCLFTGNSTGGGSVSDNDGSFPSFLNCTVSGNSAAANRAAIQSDTGSSVTIKNTIMWGDTPAEIALFGGTISVTYSAIQGGYAGVGNNAVNPRFIDADGPDNTIGTLDDNLRLAPFSRCIDAGRNDLVPADAADLDGDTNTAEPTPFDLDGSPRFADSSHVCDTGVPGAGFTQAVDMGAYEHDGAWATPGVIYVNSPSSGANNGTSWADCYTSLSTALSAAGDLVAACPGTPLQIWIASCGCNPPYVPGLSRSSTYNLVKNVGIYGGFVGNETSLSQRLPGARTTISGDIGVTGTFTDNNYHVFKSDAGIDSSAVLDGIAVVAGYADGTGVDSMGGGLHNLGSPRIVNCSFSSNSAVTGGAIYTATGSPIISKSLFHSNSANVGGAVYADGPLSLVNTTLRNNLATTSGGAVLVATASQLRMTNCVLSGNQAQFGAGYYQAVVGASATISNCTFNENRQTYLNCGSCGGVGIWINGGTMALNNSILWGNRGLGVTNQINQIFSASGSITANRNCIQGYSGLSGAGNFGGDPRFRDADGPNNFAGDPDDDLRLVSTSPCIDRGDETLIPPDIADLNNDADLTMPTPFDLDGNPRRYDVPDIADTGVGTAPLVDIGAYEFSAGDAYVCIGGKCLGDLNHDGNVDGLDTQLFVNALLSGMPCP